MKKKITVLFILLLLLSNTLTFASNFTGNSTQGYGTYSDLEYKIAATVMGIYNELCTYFLIDHEGDLYSWGVTEYGANYNDSATPNAVPKKIEGIGKVKSIKLVSTVLVILMEDGSVMTMGLNKFGQLGDGGFSTAEFKTPVFVVDGNNEKLKNIKQIGAGKEFGVAVDKNDVVYAWGKSYAFSDDETFSTAVPIDYPYETYAIKLSNFDVRNTLYDNNELTFEEIQEQTNEDVMDNSRTITDVFCSKSNIRFKLNDGSVLNIGNIYKADTTLGITPNAQARPKREMSLARPYFTMDSLGASKLTNVKKITAIEKMTFFLMENGDVYQCGREATYLPDQIKGNEWEDVPVETPYPSKIVNLSNIVDISYTGKSFFAVRDDGKVLLLGGKGGYINGERLEGKFADFTLVPGADNIAFLAPAGQTYSNHLDWGSILALTNEGSLIVWGNNTKKQLISSISNIFKPRPIYRAEKKDISDIFETTLSGSVSYPLNGDFLLGDEFLKVHGFNILTGEAPFFENEIYYKYTSSDQNVVGASLATLAPKKEGDAKIVIDAYTLDENGNEWHLGKENINFSFKVFPKEIIVTTESGIVNEINLETYDEINLFIDVLPADKDFDISFSISNDDLVEVTGDGTLVAKKPGNAILTVYAEDPFAPGSRISKDILIAIVESVIPSTLELIPDETTFLRGVENFVAVDSNQSLDDIIWEYDTDHLEMVKFIDGVIFKALQVGEHTIKVSTFDGLSEELTFTITAEIISFTETPNITIGQGDDLSLPEQIEVTYHDDEKEFKSISWPDIDTTIPQQQTLVGELSLGQFESTSIIPTVDITINSEDPSEELFIVSVGDTQELIIVAGEAFVGPNFVQGILSNDSSFNLLVNWDINNFELHTIGSQILYGTFKLPNNILNPLNLEPSFIVITEPAEIISVENIDTLLIDEEQLITATDLPQTLSCTLSNGTQEPLGVSWEESELEVINGSSEGDFIVRGQLAIPDWINGNTAVSIPIKKSVLNNLFEIEYLEDLEEVEIVVGTTPSAIHLPLNINVYSKDGILRSVTVEWDFSTYNSFALGKHILYGNLFLENDIFNPKNLVAAQVISIIDSYKPTTPDFNPDIPTRDNDYLDIPPRSSIPNRTVLVEHRDALTGALLKSTSHEVRSGSTFKPSHFTFKNYKAKVKELETIKVSKNQLFIIEYLPIKERAVFDTNNVKGYIIGYPDQTFRPNDCIKRSEVAAILSRLLLEDVNSCYLHHGFSDVPIGFWAEKEISTLSNLRLVNGYGDGSFRPNQSITIAEFSNIIANPEYQTNIGVKDSFWASKVLTTCLELEWITSEMLIRANEPITRGEVVFTINSMLNRDIANNYYIPIFKDVEEDCTYMKHILAAYFGQ